MNCDGYESDQNQVVVYDLELRTRLYLGKSWDRSPSKIIWGKDDTELYLLAEVSKRNENHIHIDSLDDSSFISCDCSIGARTGQGLLSLSRLDFGSSASYE